MRPGPLALAVTIAAAAALAIGGVASSTTVTREPAARAAAAGVGLRQVGSFDAPLLVAAPPADRRRLFVVEQGGRIVVLRDGKRLAEPFLDVSRRIVSGGEQGLLGLAFAPDYAASKRFYVYYTAAPSGANRIVAYRAASPDRADAGSARVLIDQPDSESNHNGGMLAFGPDGLLYAGFGDGGGGDDQHGTRGNAQRLDTILGKIIRIDPTPDAQQPYRIPPTNPFVSRRGARGEIYAYGLRNPWRFSFDRATGDLTIADVGQDEVEEVDFARRGRARGANYGWRPWEGRHRNFGEPAPGAIFPVIAKTHRDGWCSITGGYVVRDPKLPALRGVYVYGDYCLGQVRGARLRAGRAIGDRPLGVPGVERISSFGEDAAGRVYVVSGAGPVYRLVAR